MTWCKKEICWICAVCLEQAVAEVVLNRMASADYADTLKGVICAENQFRGVPYLDEAETGREELRGFSYDMKNIRFLTSGMKRTNETLQLLFGDVPYEEDHRFREVDFGIFEMHSYEQLKDTPAYQTWCSGNNEANVPPNGESGLQMKQRVLEAFSEIKEDTVLVCHGGVIAAIMEHLFPEENKTRYEWQPKNGHGYQLRDNIYEAI